MDRRNHVDIDSIGRTPPFMFNSAEFVSRKNNFVGKLEEEPTVKTIEDYVETLRQDAESLRRQVDALDYNVKNGDSRLRKFKETGVILSLQPTINQIYQTLVSLKEGKYNPETMLEKVRKLRASYLQQVRRLSKLKDNTLLKLTGSLYSV